MDTVTKMNGRTLSEFKNSYVLAYLVEDTFAKFNTMTKEEKITLCDKTDKLFSELFNIPRGKFVFEDKEYSRSTSELYIGKLDNIKTGAEFFFRYLFQKRQQFQRICIKNKMPLDFEDDFSLLAESYDVKPISKEPQYIPFSKGLSDYLTNYNKIDALSFAFEGIDALINMTDAARLSSNMRLGDNLSLIWSVYKIRKYENKITREMSKGLIDMGQITKKFEKYMTTIAEIKEEELFLKYLEDILDGVDGEIDRKQVLLCFHDNVWENLNEVQRKQAINICNDVISSILQCNATKNVKFEYGLNSYDFAKSGDVYVGNVNQDKPSTLLQRLVYEYSFCKNYENLLLLDFDDRCDLLKEIEKCGELLGDSKEYARVKDCHFVKIFNRTAIKMQEDIYKYINDNLVINGKKIKMPMSKNEFVLDIYKSSVRR